MDANNSKPTQGSPNVATNNWRTQQGHDLRRKIICHIINVIRQHVPVKDPTQIKSLALRLEQKMYSTATSPEDYIQKISRKLSAIKVEHKDDAPHSLPSVPPNAAENPGDQGSRGPQEQLQKPEQPFQNPVATQSQERRQLSTQNAFNNTTPSSAPLNWPNHSNRQSQCQILGQKANVPGSLLKQQSNIHGSIGVQPSLMQKKVSSVQLQNQQSLQLSAQYVDTNHSQSVLELHQQSQQLSFVQMEKPPSGQPTLPLQKQPQFPGRVEGQQHLLDEQRTGVSEVQHQQHCLSKEYHPSTNLQQRLSRQNKISRSGTQSGNSGMGNNQSIHMKHPMQQQAVQTMPASLPTNGRQSQPEPNVHKFISQDQSPPAKFLEHPHPINEEIKQTVPMSNSLFEAQKLKLQRRQFLKSGTFPAESANLKLESGQIDEDTWREEIYQWLQILKKLFLPELRELCYRFDVGLRQIMSASQPQKTAEIERRFKMLNCLKEFVTLIEMARHRIALQIKHRIGTFEKELINFLKFQEHRRMSSQHHKQLELPNMNALQQSSHPHNQNPHQLDTNMLRSVQLEQQAITKSHLGEQQYPQGNVKQQLSNKKRQREMNNMQNPFELRAQQKSGSHMNLTEVTNVKQEMGNVGTTPMQHHLSRQQQVKLEPPSPVSSPQLHQVPSIQPSQNPSPKKKQKNMQTFPERTGTSAGVQQACGAGPAAASSLQIATPGLSASPLLESSNNKDNNPGNVSEGNPHEASVIEQPLQRLLRVVNSMSPATLSASVEALESVVGITERIAGSVPEKVPKSVVDEDLAAMTRYHLQEIYSPPAFLIRGTSDSCISEMESIATFPERTMIKANNSLMEEIRTINRRLINTVVEVSDENDNSSTAASCTEDGQAKIVKCSFIALATTQNFISAHASENLLQIQPLKLLIPGTYPSRSPLVLDKSSALARHGGDRASMNNEDLSAKAISKLNLHLRSIEQPFSLEEIAKAWDACASSVVCEYAEQYGGGNFSSRYGVWKNCACA